MVQKLPAYITEILFGKGVKRKNETNKQTKNVLNSGEVFFIF
jgi:hypothetical protein